MATPPVHSDGKLYYSIGEVSELINESQNIIRKWESESKLLNTRKTRKGDRLFNYSDVQKLKAIQYLIREKGVQLSHVKKWLNSDRKIQQSEPSELIGTLLDIKEILEDTVEQLKHHSPSEEE